MPTREREDYYLTVSRLERAKGIHTILPLFGANGLRLKITGVGDGRLPFAELPSLYRRARATIIPSICRETFRLVVMEALRQQTPHGALPDLVGRTGGGPVFRSVAELGAMLGGALPVQADLSAFDPQTYLRNYLYIIAGAKSGQGKCAHALCFRAFETAARHGRRLAEFQTRPSLRRPSARRPGFRFALLEPTGRHRRVG